MATCVETASTMSQHTGTPRTTLFKEVAQFTTNDVTSLVERELLKSRSNSRRHTIEIAYNQQPVQQREKAERLKNMNLAVIVKPPASAPGAITKSYVPLELGISTTNYVSCPVTPGPYLCIRCESSHNQGLRPYVGHLSRQCCEILGPKLCNGCVRAYRRQTHLSQSSAPFREDVTTRTMTFTALLGRHFPGLSDADIRKKMYSGDICLSREPSSLASRQSSLRRSNSHLQHLETENDIHVFPHRKLLPNVLKDGPTNTYFNGLADLNHKIVRENIPRKIYMQNSVATARSSHKARADKNFPVFVSPKLCDLEPKSKYVSHYAPPLLAKDSQNTAPMFFAGSDIQYDLPERLPDDVVEVIEDDDSWRATPARGSADVMIRKPSRGSRSGTPLIT